MGRKKISISKINDERNRQVSKKIIKEILWWILKFQFVKIGDIYKT